MTSSLAQLWCHWPPAARYGSRPATGASGVGDPRVGRPQLGEAL
eukprot:COSAG01_NODE_50985_length_358_cov_1.602317_1_plen_43_part_10